MHEDPRLDKVNSWLTLLANIGVLVGIVFLAMEIQQNTEMMRAQTRDSITEKQMMLSEWIGTSEYAAGLMYEGFAGRLEPNTQRYTSFVFLVNGIWREWENSLYQHRLGLFSDDEFSARRNRWEMFMLGGPGARELWAIIRETYSVDFRSEIDSIVATLEQPSPAASQ